MAELNQYALSKILGSKMKPIKEAEFGNFSLLETTAEVLRSREKNTDLIRSSSGFTYDDDRVVCRAFEDVRDGASPDSLLWDHDLLRKFLMRCRKKGLDAPDSMLGRRLINIRKSPTRYKKHGIVLSPTTKKKPKPSIVPEYAHVIEFALLRLRYRYGVSIDDILLDTELSDRYENLAQQIAPKLSVEDLRLGALYIRKTRFVKKKDQLDIQLLDLHAIEKEWSKTICLSQIDPKDVPESPGLLEIKERDRYLYISRNEKLRSTVEQFVNGQAFQIVAGPFWKPDAHLITLQFIKGDNVIGVSARKWENRLIHDFRPVFNWPVRKVAA